MLVLSRREKPHGLGAAGSVEAVRRFARALRALLPRKRSINGPARRDLTRKKQRKLYKKARMDLQKLLKVASKTDKKNRPAVPLAPIEEVATALRGRLG